MGDRTAKRRTGRTLDRRNRIPSGGWMTCHNRRNRNKPIIRPASRTVKRIFGVLIRRNNSMPTVRRNSRTAKRQTSQMMISGIPANRRNSRPVCLNNSPMTFRRSNRTANRISGETIPQAGKSNSQMVKRRTGRPANKTSGEMNPTFSRFNSRTADRQSSRTVSRIFGETIPQAKQQTS